MEKYIDNKKQCLKYFKFFDNKDLSGLKDMFSDEIVLKDWDVSGSGKLNVLQINENIFSSVKSITINPVNMYCDCCTVISELEVVVDNNDRLSIVDVISFDKLGKIIKINAYKQ